MSFFSKDKPEEVVNPVPAVESEEVIQSTVATSDESNAVVPSGMEVLASAIEKMGETIGEKLRQPNASEARKLKQESLLRKREARLRADEAKLAMNDRNNKVARCRNAGHRIKAPNGGTRHGFRGNLNSDGCIRVQCIACNHVLPPFKAPEAIKAGSSVNEWLMLLENLNESTLIGWSHETNQGWHDEQAKKAAERKEFIQAFRADFEPDAVEV